MVVHVLRRKMVPSFHIMGPFGPRKTAEVGLAIDIRGCGIRRRIEKHKAAMAAFDKPMVSKGVEKPC